MTTTWSEIAARGNAMKIPSSNYKRNDYATTEITDLYVVDELADLLKVHRAESILEMALHNDTILFEFLAKDFSNPTEVYGPMTAKLGKMIGARIIKPNNGRSTGTFMVEAKFEKKEASTKAISEGIPIGNHQYKGIPTRADNGALPKMVKIHVAGIPFEDSKDLKEKIIDSLSPYGKICKISTLKQCGVFEGAITALIDTDPTQGEFEPLQRMLYFSAWNLFLPTTFRGQPPARDTSRAIAAKIA
ncbi:hypothetical protein BCR42DRAFT_444609 [Absidia repens]|uniref:Uncharacterized protein n=1 Tax=Absidia repens TaxID=90262 RepID=A0A1X2HLS3_9FUNG|nr:hypothetical protein BCR42DRAFT_444609 [Absidia repens]